MPSADGREIQLCKYAHTRVLDRIQCGPRPVMKKNICSMGPVKGGSAAD